MDLAGDIVQNLCSFLAIQVVMITVFLFFFSLFLKNPSYLAIRDVLMIFYFFEL